MNRTEVIAPRWMMPDTLINHLETLLSKASADADAAIAARYEGTRYATRRRDRCELYDALRAQYPKECGGLADPRGDLSNGGSTTTATTTP